MGIIPLDKLLHFLMSFFLTISLNTFLPKQAAEQVAFFIGVGKEVHDYYSPTGTAEWGDIAANVTGIITANKALEEIKCKEINAQIAERK